MLFSSRMIKALLAGAKSQTRRILTPQPEHLQRHEWKGKVLYDAEHRIWWWKQHHFENLIDFEDGRRELAQLCRYGIAGDRLWVKETFAPNDPPSGYVYRADGAHLYDRHPVKWTPAIFCSRDASRITLDITNVRVERLQDITEEDAKAEGAAYRIAPGGDLSGAFQGLAGSIGYRAHFADLWRSINGVESWDANPFVWALSFRRVDSRASCECGHARESHDLDDACSMCECRTWSRSAA